MLAECLSLLLLAETGLLLFTFRKDPYLISLFLKTKPLLLR